MNLEFQEIIEEQWSQIKHMSLQMSEIDESELSHYQLILLKKFLQEKWTEAKIDDYERNFAQQLKKIKDIRIKLEKDNLAEKISRQMDFDKDKMALLKIMVQNQQMNHKRRKSGDDQKFYSQEDIQLKYGAKTCRNKMDLLTPQKF